MLLTELHSSKLGSTRTFCSIFFFFEKILWRIFQIKQFLGGNNLLGLSRQVERVKNQKVNFMLTSFWG